MAKVSFIDAQGMHRKYPSTFQVPSKATLDKIQPGSIIKVSMKCGKYERERLWAIVKSIQGSRITATLDNEPVVCTRLKLGSTIRVQKRHVYSVDRGLVPKGYSSKGSNQGFISPKTGWILLGMIFVGVVAYGHYKKTRGM